MAAIQISVWLTEHPDDLFRNKLTDIFGPLKDVGHPQHDYFWREQGLSAQRYVAEGDAAKADKLAERAKRELPTIQFIECILSL